MTTWVDDLKKIECFLMEWGAELRCQIKENQQRRDESTQSNIDQRVEMRNLASQSHSVVNSNLEDFRSLTLSDLEVSPSTGPKSIHLESNLGGKSDNVVPSMQEVSERCSSGADATEESRRASYYSENPDLRSLMMEDDDQRQIEELRMSNRERFADLLEISQDLPPRSSSSKASMEIPAEMVESTNKLTINLPQEPHTNNSFLEENSEKLKVTLNLVEVKVADVTIEEMWESVVISIDPFVVMNAFNSFEGMKFDVAPKGLSESINMLLDRIEVEMANSGTVTMNYLANSSAQHMFDEMSSRGVVLDALIDEEILLSNNVRFIQVLFPYDRGKFKLIFYVENGYKFKFSPHEVGSTLGANSEGQNCWVMYPSTTESIPDLRGGNGCILMVIKRHSLLSGFVNTRVFVEFCCCSLHGDLIKPHGEVTLDPLEMDMLKLVDNWKDSIDVRLGDFQLNSVIFLVKFSAPKVFVKMSKKEWNDVTESVKLLSTLGYFFYSVDSSRSFVFDPGKSNKFLLHNGSVEALVTLVFDPGGDQVAEVCAGKNSILAKLVLEMEKCRS